MIAPDLVMILESGRSVRMGIIECIKCGNQWAVVAGYEHQPGHCCYCGTRFGGYVDGNGDARRLSGFRILEQGETGVSS